MADNTDSFAGGVSDEERDTRQTCVLSFQDAARERRRNFKDERRRLEGRVGGGGSGGSASVNYAEPLER